MVSWNVDISTNIATLKTKLSMLRGNGTGVIDIIYHEGVGYAVTYLESTGIDAPNSYARLDWEVESIADESALEIKLNELRELETGVDRIIYNIDTATFSVIYLRPTYNFGSSANIISAITNPTISV